MRLYKFLICGLFSTLGHSQHFELGAGPAFENVPLYSNTTLKSIFSQDPNDPGVTSYYSSDASHTGYLGIQIDPCYHFLDSQNIDIQIKGQLLYDLTFLVNSLSGSTDVETESEYLHYQGGIGIDVGAEMFKLSLDYNAGIRLLSYSSKMKSDFGSAGIVESEETGSANYFYHNASAGLLIGWDSELDYGSYVKPKFIFEKNEQDKNFIWGIGLDLRTDFCDVRASVFPKYTLGGTPLYEFSGKQTGVLCFLAISKNILF